MPGEHFVIQKTDQVPQFLEMASREIGPQGELGVGIWDIVGCYPAMPKETIRFAMRNVLQEVTRSTGCTEVWVPKHSDQQPCRWKSRKGAQAIPFEVMLDVCEFSLDFAVMRMPKGDLKRQRWGIPMGDPLSPAMAIAACAWMESEWMQQLTDTDKRRFRARRFMDDILMCYAKNEHWDYSGFVADFE